MMKRQAMKSILVFIGIGLAYYLLLKVMDSQTSCYSKAFWGIPCPGCGMTRSVIHLTKGEFLESFYDHPLVFLIPIALYLGIMTKINKDPLKAKWIIRGIYLVCLIFILVYLIRMTFYFPHQEPMLFHENGLFPRVIKGILNQK